MASSVEMGVGGSRQSATNPEVGESSPSPGGEKEQSIAPVSDPALDRLTFHSGGILAPAPTAKPGAQKNRIDKDKDD